MPGLHGDVLRDAVQSQLPIELGRPVPWLSGHGHLNPVVTQSAPASVIDALSRMHEALGGKAELLASKRLGNPPTPDLSHSVTGGIIEVDEVQHFTTARLKTFEFYPSEVPVGYDLEEYKSLTLRWRVRGDAAFAHKVASDFPDRGGRQAQRAYNDALRDLLAPTFTRCPCLRIAVPDRAPSPGAFARAMATFWQGAE